MMSSSLSVCAGVGGSDEGVGATFTAAAVTGLALVVVTFTERGEVTIIFADDAMDCVVLSCCRDDDEDDVVVVVVVVALGTEGLGTVGLTST